MAYIFNKAPRSEPTSCHNLNWNMYVYICICVCVRGVRVTIDKYKYALESWSTES